MRGTSAAVASSYGTIRAAPPPPPPPATPRPSSSSSSSPPSAAYVKLPTADSTPSSTRISDLVSRFKEQGHALLSARRPWQELFHPPSFSRPPNIADAITRIRRNVTYFRANYILTILAVLLVGLFYHPFSFFTCAALAAAWFFLYFSRTAPLTILGTTFDDGSVLLWLTVATVVSLLFTNVGWNVIGSMTVGVALVGLHAAFRSTDDLFLTEQEAAGGGGGFLNPTMAQFAQVL